MHGVYQGVSHWHMLLVQTAPIPPHTVLFVQGISKVTKGFHLITTKKENLDYLNLLALVNEIEINKIFPTINR